METIGARLKFARTLRRLGARELGRLVGLSHNAVSFLESDSSPPTVDTIAALAAALRCSPGWLAFGEGALPEETEEDRAREAPKRGRPKKEQT